MSLPPASRSTCLPVSMYLTTGVASVGKVFELGATISIVSLGRSLPTESRAYLLSLSDAVCAYEASPSKRHDA
eukprot:1925589-Rhodomonas_salina.1